MLDVLEQIKQASKVVSNNEMVTTADVDKARKSCVEASAKEQSSVKAYATILNRNWAALDWFDVAWNDKDDAVRMVHNEREIFVTSLAAKGHSNPRVVWQRIRETAKELRYPNRNEAKIAVASEKNETQTRIVRINEGAQKENSAPPSNTALISALNQWITEIKENETPTPQQIKALPHLEAALVELRK